MTDFDAETRMSRSDAAGDEEVGRLVEECLERMETEGDQALEEVCAANPRRATTIRRRIEKLRGLDLVAGPPPDLHLRPESRLGSYRLIERRGERAGVETWLAEREEDAKPALVRVVIDPQLLAPGMRERLLRGLDRAALLTHPGLLRTPEVGRGGSRIWFASERVEARRLPDPFNVRALGARRGLGASLALQLCRTIDYAHACGVVHGALGVESLLLRSTGELLVDGMGLRPVDFDTGRDADLSALRSLAAMLVESDGDLGARAAVALRSDRRDGALTNLMTMMAGLDALSREAPFEVRSRGGWRAVLVLVAATLLAALPWFLRPRALEPQPKEDEGTKGRIESIVADLTRSEIHLGDVRATIDRLDERRRALALDEAPSLFGLDAELRRSTLNSLMTSSQDTRETPRILELRVEALLASATLRESSDDPNPALSEYGHAESALKRLEATSVLGPKQIAMMLQCRLGVASLLVEAKDWNGAEAALGRAMPLLNAAGSQGTRSSSNDLERARAEDIAARLALVRDDFAEAEAKSEAAIESGRRLIRERGARVEYLHVLGPIVRRRIQGLMASGRFEPAARLVEEFLAAFAAAPMNSQYEIDHWREQGLLLDLAVEIVRHGATINGIDADSSARHWQDLADRFPSHRRFLTRAFDARIEPARAAGPAQLLALRAEIVAESDARQVPEAQLSRAKVDLAIGRLRIEGGRAEEARATLSEAASALASIQLRGPFAVEARRLALLLQSESAYAAALTGDLERAADSVDAAFAGALTEDPSTRTDGARLDLLVQILDRLVRIHIRGQGPSFALDGIARARALNCPGPPFPLALAASGLLLRDGLPTDDVGGWRARATEGVLSDIARALEAGALPAELRSDDRFTSLLPDPRFESLLLHSKQ